MIKPTVLSALNKQIQHEQSNAHAYEAASLYFGRVNLHGLEAYMAQQVQDERMHAVRLIEHVRDRGAQVELLAIGAPKNEFASPLEAVNSVRDLERATTETIHRLFELRVRRTIMPWKFCCTGTSPSRSRRRSGPASWQRSCSSSTSIPGRCSCWITSGESG